MPRQFDLVIERDEEGYYVASVSQIPACHTQARSLDVVPERVRETTELCLEVEGPEDPFGVRQNPADYHRPMGRIHRVTGTELSADEIMNAL